MHANPLIAKLETVAELDDEDRCLLDGLCGEIVEIAAKRDIIADGARPAHVHLILDGWAACYKILPDGSRQFMAFLIPGDFCDIHVTILGAMDHGILALTPCRVALVSGARLDELTMDHSALARALWWATLVDEGVLRAWVVNNGRRDAYAAIAHLVCELHARMKMIGLVEDQRFDLPITQEELADAVGLTAVHTNRILQRLRTDGLIELEEKVLTVLDVEQLSKVAGFDPTYLHVQRRPLRA
jgi:CRP-like cAMP-binding protein